MIGWTGSLPGRVAAGISYRARGGDERARGSGRRVLASALLAVLAPKCPMCVAAYLAAVGVGAGGVAPWLVRAGQVAAVAALGVIGVGLVRRRRWGALAWFAVAAAALVGAVVAWPMLLWPRLVAAGALVLAVGWGGRARAACGCAGRAPHAATQHERA